MGLSSTALPKPLVQIGDKPILWHVMNLFAGQQDARFVLLLGHGAEQIESFARDLEPAWDVVCVRTGVDTPTAGRIERARAHLDHRRFCLCYADGLADLDLAGLLEFHRLHAATVTMTVTRPPNPWGIADVGADGRVQSFAEKRELGVWANAGFFVMEPAVFDYLGPAEALEERPLSLLATAGQLYAYRHTGFWACMDTHKDTQALNALWQRGAGPWQALDAVS